MSIMFVDEPTRTNVPSSRLAPQKRHEQERDTDHGGPAHVFGEDEHGRSWLRGSRNYHVGHEHAPEQASDACNPGECVHDDVEIGVDKLECVLAGVRREVWEGPVPRTRSICQSVMQRQ